MIKKYFGIIKWYDKQKEFGLIKCHDIGYVGFKNINLLNQIDEDKIDNNKLVLFSIKTNKQGRYIAENITFDYSNYVVANYVKFDEALIQILINYANEETKTKLISLLEMKELIKKPNIGQTQITISGIENSTVLESLIKINNPEFNANLFKLLTEGLSIINDDLSYQVARQLIQINSINSKTHYPDLIDVLYEKATNTYKFKFWLDGIVNFCNIDSLRKRFEHGDENLKNQILFRCKADENGFLVNPSKMLKNPNEIEEVYFSNIQNIVLQEIYQAKDNILVAVAWFTNHHFLDALCEKVKEGVNVEIMILNDYINNSIEGLDFQHFINLGKENAKSKFYFCGIENIMHHKFCIIDNHIVFNGSYNWTYYAEHRNHENCMFFKNKKEIVTKFKSEFDNIKKQLEIVETITPFDHERLNILDLFSAKHYRSKDLEYKAKECKQTNKLNLASRLITLSLQINPENDEALKFKKEIEIFDEELIRKQAIEKEIKEKQRQQEDLKIQIEHQIKISELREQQEKERIIQEQKKREEEHRLLNEKLFKQEEEKKRLAQQETELRANKVLEEQERLKLIEIENQRKLLQQKQEKEQAERIQKEREAERLRNLQQLKIAEEKRQQENLIKQQEIERLRIVEQKKQLEEAQNVSFQGKRGELRINLQWKTFDDLDLHVYDPDNNHIFYSTKQATCQNSLGQLDVDANAGSGQTQTPQENIFWKTLPPEGIYKVEVNHYTKRELADCPFIVTISPNFGETKILTGKMNGEKSTVKVATFSYSHNEGMKLINSI